MKTKLIYSLIIVVLLSGCQRSSLKYLEAKSDEINTILKNPFLFKTMGLDKADNLRPFIRIVDLSKTYIGYDSFFKYGGKDGKLLIPYHVLKQVGYDMNTGNYRDLILLSKKEDGEKVAFEFIVASYETQNWGKDTYWVYLTYLKKNGKLELLEQKQDHWRDKVPDIHK